MNKHIPSVGKATQAALHNFNKEREKERERVCVLRRCVRLHVHSPAQLIAKSST